MNKNNAVLLADYNEKYQYIVKIIEIYNPSYAPLAMNMNNNYLENINKWFQNRPIPKLRKNLKKLLERLNVQTTEELLNKAYGLSLSDQYWLKEENSKITWKDINFFNNDFEYEAYLEASLDSSPSATKVNEKVLKSPNNTTDGMLQKGWIIEDNKRVLVKGTYTPNREEPFNEVLASMISKVLNFYYCEYKITWLDDNVVSKCSNFISEDEEIITAYDVFNSKKKPNNISDYEHYISILEEHKVPNARRNVASMFLVDYLMLNTDRHLKNFGIIRNVNTLEWVRTTPIFDSGEAMECDKFTYNMNFSNGYGKFFSNTNKDYEEIFKVIKNDLPPLNLHNLDKVILADKDMLLTYQKRLEISDARINALVKGLTMRINILKDNLE